MDYRWTENPTQSTTWRGVDSSSTKFQFFPFSVAENSCYVNCNVLKRELQTNNAKVCQKWLQTSVLRPSSYPQQQQFLNVAKAKPEPILSCPSMHFHYLPPPSRLFNFLNSPILFKALSLDPGYQFLARQPEPSLLLKSPTSNSPWKPARTVC